jgi:hypothetical protein
MMLVSMNSRTTIFLSAMGLRPIFLIVVVITVSIGLMNVFKD